MLDPEISKRMSIKILNWTSPARVSYFDEGRMADWELLKDCKTVQDYIEAGGNEMSLLAFQDGGYISFEKKEQ